MKPNSRQTEALRAQWHLPHNTDKLHRLMQCIQIYIQAARLITSRVFLSAWYRPHICELDMSARFKCYQNCSSLSHNPLSLCHKASKTSDPQVPSPLQSITDPWPIPDHTAQWQHHNVCEQLVWVTVWKWKARFPSSVTLEFKDFQGLFQGLSTTTMHIPKDIPVDWWTMCSHFYIATESLPLRSHFHQTRYGLNTGSVWRIMRTIGRGLIKQFQNSQ